MKFGPKSSNAVSFNSSWYAACTEHLTSHNYGYGVQKYSTTQSGNLHMLIVDYFLVPDLWYLPRVSTNCHVNHVSKYNITLYSEYVNIFKNSLASKIPELSGLASLIEANYPRFRPAFCSPPRHAFQGWWGKIDRVEPWPPLYLSKV